MQTLKNATMRYVWMITDWNLPYGRYFLTSRHCVHLCNDHNDHKPIFHQYWSKQVSKLFLFKSKVDLVLLWNILEVRLFIVNRRTWMLFPAPPPCSSIQVSFYALVWEYLIICCLCSYNFMHPLFRQWYDSNFPVFWYLCSILYLIGISLYLLCPWF